VLEQRQIGSDREWESDVGLHNEDDDEFERAGRSPSVQLPGSYDPGHLAGSRQNEFEAQQQGHRGEKTTEERREEEIVMEYIKKQSLLEVYHQNKGKARATAIEDTDDKEE